MRTIKYHILDDAKNTCQTFGSLTELAMHIKHASNLMANLNITGNDTIRLPDGNTESQWNPVYQIYLTSVTFTYYLRRYRIMDSDDRHIDPRIWPKSFWAKIPELPRRTYHYWHNGNKSHRRRVSGPSLKTRDARILNHFQSNLDVGSLTDNEAALVQDLHIPSIKLRPANKRYPIRDYNWYESQFNARCHRATDKSWKKNRHANKQYMRHKPPKQTVNLDKRGLFDIQCEEEQRYNTDESW